MARAQRSGRRAQAAHAAPTAPRTASTPAVPTREPDLHQKVIRVSELNASHLTQGMLWIVVFGPGHGEAILIRLPDGRVGIVDGCKEPDAECPLTTLLNGLAPPKLLFACLTHPHEDHYKGLARLINARSGLVENIWHVMAMTSNECPAMLRYAKKLFKTTKRARLPDRGEWRRMDAVFRAIMEAEAGGTRRRDMRVEVPLFREQVGPADLEMLAWGPTEKDVGQALLQFVRRAKQARIAKDDLPNHVSASLFIRWGASRALLAGDLFRNADAHRGWGPARALATAHSPVQVVNVAHHASENAHDDLLWQTMSPTLAIVTPFQNAAMNNKKQPCQPPTPADIQRLVHSGAHVAITALPDWLGTALTPLPPRNLDVQRPPPPPPIKVRSSPLLHAVPTPGPSSAHNSVAVALDHQGNIVQVVLSGDSDFYA